MKIINGFPPLSTISFLNIRSTDAPLVRLACKELIIPQTRVSLMRTSGVNRLPLYNYGAVRYNNFYDFVQTASAEFLSILLIIPGSTSAEIEMGRY